MALAGATLQILLAIVVVIIFGVIGFMIYNWEQLKAVQTTVAQRKAVPIFVGIKDLKSCGNESYNTVVNNPLDPNFRDMSDAVNQPGGAEITYNFWLYVHDQAGTTIPLAALDNGVFKTDSGIKGDQVILFLRGSPKAWDYNSLCKNTDDTPKTKTDVLVKCPLVKLENGGDALSVEFNTMLSPNVVIANSMNTCGSISKNWNTMNGYKLGIQGLTSNSSLAKKWNMITVVIQDTNPSDPLPMRNKVRCRIFVNGGVELDKYVDGSFTSSSTPKQSISTLKQNTGDFWFAPEIKNSSDTTVGFYAKSANGAITKQKLMMADLTYYNYALSTSEIANLFNANFTKVYAPVYGATKTIANDDSWMKNVAINNNNYKLSTIANGASSS